MSILADKTEKAAIKELACCLRHFDNLANLKMTFDDAFGARLAENLIKTIIESSGYSVAYEPGSDIVIQKIKP